MINEKSLRIITEDQPSHFWNTYCSLPITIKMIWLKRFLKKDITKEDFYRYISYKQYYSSLDEYKKTEHFLILKDVLEINLENYDWLCNQTIFVKRPELEREISIWQIQR